MAQPKPIQIKDSIEAVGQDVVAQGWVHTVRDMGKIVFIELRDPTGILQLVVDDPDKLPKIGNEYVVIAKGQIRRRGERYVNSKLATGTVEMGVSNLNVISASKELPFELKDTLGVNEELRLKYRYLDLRSDRMAANLKLRHRVVRFVRNFLDENGFIEVETPLLTKGTPEGAREFLVPSRLHAEEFYVLPQSPQQFKQLLMVAGIGRYYQIAKCLRDEDQRGDRQPEFSQIDMELSFVSQEDILQLNEVMMIRLIEELFPEKHITKVPFPRLTYSEAIEKYGSDRPDLRSDKEDANELAFCWITDFPMFEINQESSKIDAVHHPFTAPKDEDVTSITKDPMKVRADAYDLALNGNEIGGGSIRIHDRELQYQVLELLGLGKTEIEARFGHMLEAFKYGAPPHGGIAYGLDRLLMILCGAPNIREVIAFPKTGDGRDPLTGAPSPASPQALKEAHVQTVKAKRE